MNHSTLSRRDLLRAGGALAAGTLLSGIGIESAARAAVESADASRKRVLRIGYMTDTHVQPELAADKGLAACLHHLQDQKDRPDVIFNGGDAVMDTLGVDADRAELQWNLWTGAFKQECSLPVEHCLGNHDVWGWDKKASHLTGDEPKYGKARALEVLGLEKPYRSFDRAGWHFVMLDSMTFHPSGAYIAKLDNEQFEWLGDDLETVDAKTPVCVVSHIPLLSGAAFYDGDHDKTGYDWRVPGYLMHVDARRVMDLFLKHRNVRLCMSGHLHLTDRVDFNGVTYLCNGAVSGDWWKGKHQECDAGYALVDLYDDGSFERQYIEYGWKPHYDPKPAKQEATNGKLEPAAAK